MKNTSLSPRFNKHLKERYNVTSKELENWLNEYNDDVDSGAIDWCSKDRLKLINLYLYDIKLQKQYRKCTKYRKIDEGMFEGILRKTNDKILIECDLDLRGDRYNNLRLYLNGKMVCECGKQSQIINWIDKYLKNN